MQLHTVAIWTFTFHKKSGFERLMLKANFNSTYRPTLSLFWLKIQIYNSTFSFIFWCFDTSSFHHKSKKKINPSTARFTKKEEIQVDLFQKHLSLHQLTHNMTKDFSWNYHENYKRRTWAEHTSF